MSKQTGLGGREFGADSPLFGGGGRPNAPVPEEMPRRGFDRSDDDFSIHEGNGALTSSVEGQDSSELLPAPTTGREVDDWGRSEHFMRLMQPLLDFYYYKWFRVETEGIENVPSEGGALLVSNHSGAVPPDGPMIMEAVRNEHPNPRPVYMLGEHWFKGYPGIGALANKIGMIPAHPDNAQRLLHDEGGLAAVFPEGQKGTRKVLWQRYRLRRFGRGGFVRTALRARVPIVPIALVGGEEAMPIWMHLRIVQRLTGLIYAPLNHATPLGPLAMFAYLPAKFRIRFGEPIDTSQFPDDTIDDAAMVQAIAEEVRARIKESLDEMLARRSSVWLG